jgi:hypothetical protein
VSESRPTRFTVSLYADDAGIFIGPEQQDMEVVREILQAYGDASGLRTNMEKSEVFPIGCTEEQITAALTFFWPGGELFLACIWGCCCTLAG